MIFRSENTTFGSENVILGPKTYFFVKKLNFSKILPIKRTGKHGKHDFWVRKRDFGPENVFLRKKNWFFRKFRQLNVQAKKWESEFSRKWIKKTRWTHDKTRKFTKISENHIFDIDFLRGIRIKKWFLHKNNDFSIFVEDGRFSTELFAWQTRTFLGTFFGFFMRFRGLPRVLPGSRWSAGGKEEFETG